MSALIPQKSRRMNMRMRYTFAMLLVFGLLVSGMGEIDASPLPPIDVSASNSAIPNGTKVFITIGGDGCNCQGATSGTIRGGKVSVTLNTGRCVPNEKCKVFGRATTAAGDKYAGSNKIFTTNTGSLYSSFSLDPV